jgi:hypothetical protein
MDLLVPHHLNTRLIEGPVCHNLVPSNPGNDLGPEEPVDGTKQQDTNTHDGEDVVWIALGVPALPRWEKGHDDEEEVGDEPQNGDG